MLTKNFDFVIEDMEIDHSSCFGGVCPMTKTASSNPLNKINQKKNHAYLLVIAMGAGDFYGENNNGDFFYEKDLKDYYHTFKSAGVFVQHFNKDPAKSIGNVVNAIYNDEMHRVELIIEISKKKSPEHYQAIERGERIKVSMGVKVPQEMCSFCGSITKGSIANRCDHLKFEMHAQKPNGQVVYAINIPPMNFFDISIVRRPADAQGHALFQKVASEEDGIEIDKVAELVKYMNAMKAAPEPMSADGFFEMKKKMSPETIKRIIISKRIMLKPSEAMILGTNISRDKVGECREHCDTPEFIKILMDMASKNTCPNMLKMANAIDYTNTDIDKLVSRTEIVKTASSTTAYGRRKISSPVNGKLAVAKVRDRGSYGEYKVNYLNGQSSTFRSQGIFGSRKVPDYFLTLVDDGYAHSITGILPSGDEALVYGSK